MPMDDDGECVEHEWRPGRVVIDVNGAGVVYTCLLCEAERYDSPRGGQQRS
jgi:hypothetical protein